MRTSTCNNEQGSLVFARIVGSLSAHIERGDFTGETRVDDDGMLLGSECTEDSQTS